MLPMTFLRIAVTGKHGQLVSSLLEHKHGQVKPGQVLAVGRPELDFERPESIQPALITAKPDVIINAAAYTAVDLAEQEEEKAFLYNCEGARQAALAAKALNIPIIHISTDYVFDGTLTRPYMEDDQANPASAYGRSKWAGEQAVESATDNHAIFRTAWVYSPFGKNFVKTMLHLGSSRSEVSVVADQTGNPTSALDSASILLAIAQQLHDKPYAENLRGLFHLTGQGTANWADVAEAIFEEAALQGRHPVVVKRITTADYPAPARRPANSQLNNRKLIDHYGVQMPAWQTSLKHCVKRLLAGTEQAGR
jgi:dTDP-4-dehydrorhamnose reductase